MTPPATTTAQHRALADEQRAGIVAELEASPDGLDASEIGRRLGRHANTIRWHLGILGPCRHRPLRRRATIDAGAAADPVPAWPLDQIGAERRVPAARLSPRRHDLQGETRDRGMRSGRSNLGRRARPWARSGRQRDRSGRGDPGRAGIRAASRRARNQNAAMSLPRSRRGSSTGRLRSPSRLDQRGTRRARVEPLGLRARDLSAAECVHRTSGAPAERRSVAAALTHDELRLLDAYWRAANYLSVGQIYLLDNPLLREPLQPEHVKPRLLGHFGTVARPEPRLRAPEPGDPRRATSTRSSSPARATAAPALVAERLPRGDLQRALPERRRATRTGCARSSASSPSPAGSRATSAPETPGSIHEGGELGYALAHAFGAAFDNPDLVVACVVGDGEAETGPLAASWHSNKFLNPRRDGAVLPILHLNGYKIANPTVLARIPESELAALFEGYGWRPDRRLGRLRRAGRGGAPALRRRARRARSTRSRQIQHAARGRRRSSGRAGRCSSCARRRAGRARARSTACRSRGRGARTRCRSPASGRTPEHSRAARGVDAQLPAGGALRRRRPAASRSWPRWRPRASGG